MAWNNNWHKQRRAPSFQRPPLISSPPQQWSRHPFPAYSDYAHPSHSQLAGVPQAYPRAPFYQVDSLQQFASVPQAFPQAPFYQVGNAYQAHQQPVLLGQQQAPIPQQVPIAIGQFSRTEFCPQQQQAPFIPQNQQQVSIGPHQFTRTQFHPRQQRAPSIQQQVSIGRRQQQQQGPSVQQQVPIGLQHQFSGTEFHPLQQQVSIGRRQQQQQGPSVQQQIPIGLQHQFSGTEFHPLQQQVSIGQHQLQQAPSVQQQVQIGPQQQFSGTEFCPQQQQAPFIPQNQQQVQVGTQHQSGPEVPTWNFQAQQVHKESIKQVSLKPVHKDSIKPERGDDGWYPACEESFTERVKHDLDMKDITPELSVCNYKRKFNNLICWEEKSSIDVLIRKCDRKCDLTLFQCEKQPPWIRSLCNYKVPMRYGFLENVTADQIAYATQACEAVFIVSPDRTRELRMEILRENYNHTDEKLYVAFRKDESNKLCRIISSRSLPEGETIFLALLVEFEVKHEYFDSLVKTVNSMHQGIIKRLLPSPIEFFKPMPISEFELQSLLSNMPCGIEIDDNQLNALRTIISSNRSSPPLIVNGSFGTGKTRLLAVATYCLIYHGLHISSRVSSRVSSPVRILLCAHHYESVNYFIQQYFCKMFNEKSEITVFRLISETSRDWDRVQFSKLFKDIQEYHLQHPFPDYLLVVTEFLTAQPLSEIYGAEFFTHILLDEGSQTVEPEAITPLTLAGPNTKIVIVGDSCQVGPSLKVLGEESRKNGLKFSLQERLQQLYTKQGGLALKHMTSLNTNYRCHERIVQIPNKLFYESKIQACPLNALAHPRAEFPLLFVCSSLTTEVDCEFEAKLLMKYFEDFMLLDNWPTDRWGEKDLRKICLVTASRFQLVVARKLLRREHPQLSWLTKILTTYSIQGQEFQAVFLSTVEPVDEDGNTTNPTKSPCDPYVFNTVLTRSKSLVVVVGSPVALLKIEEHMVKKYGSRARCWSSYLKLCLEKRTFFIPAEVESNNGTKEAFVSSLRSQLSGEVAKFVPGTNENVSTQVNATQKRHVASPAPPLARSIPLTRDPPSKTRTLLSPSHQPAVNWKPPLLPTPPVSSPLMATQPRMTVPSSSYFKRMIPPSVRRLPEVFVPPPRAIIRELPRHVTQHSQFRVRDHYYQPASLHCSVNIGTQATPSCVPSESAPRVSVPRVSVPRDREVLLKQELTVDNYVTKFHALLDVEEEEHRIQLTGRCNDSYEIELFDAEFIPRNLSYEDEEKYVQFGCITTGNSERCDKLAYAKYASEASLITVSEYCRVRVKHVQGMLPNHVHSYAILIAFDGKELKLLEAAKKHHMYQFKAEVKFEIQRFYFKMLHNSLNNLSTEAVQKLIPNRKVFSSYEPGEFFPVSKAPFESIELDSAQMSALYLILKSSPALPVLIAGSFGSGKTRLLARAAYEILKGRRRRVLICAHHQSSVDTFVNYFCEMKYNRNTPNRNNRSVWAVEMIRIVANDSYTSSTRDKYKLDDIYKAKNGLTLKDLDKYQLVLTTFSTASNLFTRLQSKQGQRGGLIFTDVLMDEGAQIREPEMVGALGWAGKETKIIIVGDHYQVGPNILVLGEKARANGLNVSPLERLHSLYDKARTLLSDSCSFTLLTNYRCHGSILMLPSSLYYQSALMCRAESITHHLAPFPLSFVCSDTKQDFQGMSGVNEKEASALMKEVEKYFSTWPNEWRERRKRICIITPSPNQLNCLKRKAKSLNIAVEIQYEILPAYNVQGTEFEAVFISTSEATNKSYEPLMITRSICDRFVFNTVLTRARSLVVAVGNPFYLLKMEEAMIKRHDDLSYSTWKPYIKQCLECSSFSYSEDIDKSSINDTTRQLYEHVYTDSVQTSDLQSYSGSKSSDSILENYQKLFEGAKGCKGMKLLLSSNKDAQLTWNVQESDERSVRHRPKTPQFNYSDRYVCKLKFLNFRKVEATPLSDTKQEVLIQGRRNLRNAFDGDVAEVGVFEDCPSDTLYGRVLKVKKRYSNPQYVCRVADYSPITFFPIDKKNPKLINFPTLSRVILRERRKEKVIPDSDFKYNDVIVFDPNSYEPNSDGIHLPRVVQVIPHPVALKMLFVVSFVMWKKNYVNPLGIVIGACSKGHTLLKAELLLKLEHSVTYNSEDNDSTGPGDVEIDPSLPSLDRVFTIDPSDAKNLDDALSIIKQGDRNGHSVYQMGVHIVNAAKHITVDSAEDVAAKKCGISVYGGKKGGKMMHMLGNGSTRRALSLFPGQLRDAISVTCDVTLLEPSGFIFSISNINPAQIRSAIKMSYGVAQDLMKGIVRREQAAQVQAFNADINNPSLGESLKLLYNIAMEMRRRRLRSDSAFVYDIDDPGEEKNWQAHLLVSELMIWANNEVAKKIHLDYPNASVLRKQDPPASEKLERIIENHKNTMSGSLYLSQYLNAADLDIAESDILLPYDTVNKALSELDPVILAHLLSSDKFYPQLAPVTSKLKCIAKRSEYCCTEENERNPATYRHYSLCLDDYTHFTSPIRRYVDIVVQRILLQQSDLSHDDLEELCIAFNSKKRNASSFEKAISRVRLACEFLNSSEVCTAYVSQQLKSSVEIAFPDPDMKFKDLPVTARILETSRCFPHARDSDVYTWRLRVTSLGEEHAAMLLQLPGYSVTELFPSAKSDPKTDRLKAYCSLDDSTLNVQQFLANPHESAVAISWHEIQQFIKMPNKKNMQIVKEMLPNPPSTSPKFAATIKTPFLFIDCDVKLSLKESDPVKVWLSWSVKEPVISPAIQLLEVSPLLRVCLQHNTYPAECFSDPDLQEASRRYYHSIEFYADLWKKVVLAEAAVKSVHECQPTVILGVQLKWPELKIPDNCIETQHYVPTNPIRMVLPGKFVDNCSEFFRIRVGDLICARYGCDCPEDNGVRAVYHFVVHGVQEEVLEDNKQESKQGSKPKRNSNSRRKQPSEQEGKQDVTILLEPVGSINCQISTAIKEKLESEDEKYLCEIQIVPMSASYRKIFNGLLALSKGKISYLARNVAVNTSKIRGRNDYLEEIKDLTAIIGEDELVKSISKWDPEAESEKTAPTVLNTGQEEAMDEAIHKPFQLIQGPPGTGKSVVGAHIAYVFTKLNKVINTPGSHKSVLYCGPSNKSVDVVFKKFVELLEVRPLEVRILRIYSSAVERKDFPGPKLQTQQTLPDNSCPEWANQYSLHHLIRNPENVQEEFVALRKLEEKLEDMAKKNKIANGKLCSEYRRVLNTAEEEYLVKQNFDIVFSTCNEASGGRMKRHWKTLTPRQCIIDECGMAYEPETIIPIGLCEHAVLIGDHKQLQPVIEYPLAKDNGLITSLFERYAKYYERHIYKLQTQYRMHKAICAFPSEEFYENGLETDVSVLNREDNENLEDFWPKGNKCPIMFVDVVGEEGQDIGSSKREAKVGVDSKYNGKEVKLVIEIVRVLHFKHRVPLTEIAILTPYSAQKNKVLEMLKDLDEPLDDLKVASITESQGDEYGYVILSTVRSQPLEEIKHKHYVQPDRSWMMEYLGFITDKHQINVGITRSKYGLVITGNKTLLEYDSTWERLLQHYEHKGCVVQDTRFI